MKDLNILILMIDMQREETIMNKKFLGIGIIILFLFSALTPMAIGFNVRITNEKDIQSITSSNGPMDSPWPMFGHDIRHTSRSPYGTNGNCLYEKWRIKLADFITFSSPVIDNNGIIYIGTVDGTLHAINSDGTEKWRFTTTDNMDSEMTTPSIDENGTIYVATKNSYLYAINPNGTEKWRVGLQWYIHSSPVIANDGTIFIGGDEKFYAIFPNGTIKWEFSTGLNIKSSPAIDKDGIVYVASHDGYLYAFYPNNGTLRWKIGIAGQISCYSSPAIDDNGIIYIGTRNDFYAICPNGTVKWKHEGGGCYYGGPSIGFDGTIYAAGGDTLWAFSPDGAIMWSIWMGEYHPSPATSNTNMIYMAAGKGSGIDSNKICLISPSGEKIFCLTLEGDKPYLGSHLSSSPTIGSDGTVYIGSWFHSEESFDGYLHAIKTFYDAPPRIPNVSGPTKGRPVKEYTYTAVTTDSDSDNVSYYFDWGDGTNSGWTEYVSSGSSVKRSHSWNWWGTYTIKVKAKDDYDMEGYWEILKVTMPKNKISTTSLLLKLLEQFPLLQKLLYLIK